MIGFLRPLLDRVRALVTGRDPRFPPAERAFIRAHPTCIFCGGKATTAHHTRPVHAYPELEMDQSLWVPTCAADHRPYGHAGDWSKWVERLALLKAAALLRAGRLAEALAIIRTNTLGPKRPKG